MQMKKQLSRYYDRAARGIFEELGIEACEVKEMTTNINRTGE